LQPAALITVFQVPVLVTVLHVGVRVDFKQQTRLQIVAGLQQERAFMTLLYCEPFDVPEVNLLRPGMPRTAKANIACASNRDTCSVMLVDPNSTEGKAVFCRTLQTRDSNIIVRCLDNVPKGLVPGHKVQAANDFVRIEIVFVPQVCV
jgi:hypothetical protein